MPTISQINQQLSSYTVSLSTIKDSIEALASAKSVSISYNVDTPITLLSKISSNIIPTPTTTISLSSNGIFSCASNKYADVDVSDPNNIGAEIIKGTITSFIDTNSSISLITSYLLQYRPLSIVSLPVCSLIGVSAFIRCDKLETLSLPMCQYIYNYGFYGCSSLTTLYLPSLIYISSSTFGACVGLTSANFPECAIIYSYGLCTCTNLKTLSVPKCTIIYSGAMSGCVSLESLYVGLQQSNICYLSSTSALKNTPMSNSTYLGYYGSIYVPSSLVASYKTATNWTAFANRITSYIE